ncbi:MAG: hypothetical protein KDB29_00690, partial [Planctomycetes bacterium]|nr:hypothetical protein [Planctomycetota bacterium]
MHDIPAEQAYLFRHAMLREAAYELHLPSTRSALHGLALNLIEEHFGGRPPDFLLAPARESKPDPHPLDAFAAEMAAHAAAASNPVEALYLKRAAYTAENDFRYSEAIGLWRKLRELKTTDESAEAGRRAGSLAVKLG